jgi:hypothetical protein
MLRTIKRLFVFIMIGLLRAELATAQQMTVRLANPTIVEVRVSGAPASDSDTYRLEIFPAGADTQSATPLRTVDFSAAALGGPDRSRFDIAGTLNGLPEGEYIATVRTVTATGMSARSAPSGSVIVVPVKADEAPPLPRTTE